MYLLYLQNYVWVNTFYVYNIKELNLRWYSLYLDIKSVTHKLLLTAELKDDDYINKSE